MKLLNTKGLQAQPGMDKIEEGWNNIEIRDFSLSA